MAQTEEKSPAVNQAGRTDKELAESHATTMKCHDPFSLCVTSVMLTMTPSGLCAVLTHLSPAVAELPSLVRIPSLRLVPLQKQHPA